MRFSWRIGTVFGIGLFVHATFPLLLLWVAYIYYRETHQITAAVSGVIFILSVFVIVVMHELGHALTARRYGIQTRDITLLPIGGVARLERLPEEPRQELAIAVAGPAVNVALAGLLFVVLSLAGRPPSVADLSSPEGSFLNSMLWVNVWLVLFNALPAFPMDGGRVLRASLAMRMNHARATQIAATVGKTFAILFAVVGFFVLQNPFLLLIAFFVWIGASGEASMARFKYDLGGARTEAVIIREVTSLQPHDPLAKAIEDVLAGFQQDFPVLDEGRLVGLLTREDLLKALATQGQSGLVRDAMRTEFPVADLQEGVEHAFGKLQAANMRTIPVVSNGVFEGVVTTENIAEYLMVQAALRGARS